MDDGFIPLSVPNLRGNEREYINDALDREWVSTGGSYITQFEERFAAYAKVPKAVACQSGTAALHLALIECGVGPGDLVIAPALTFIASINPIRYLGADPVFIDADSTLCLDPEKLERYFREKCVVRRRTPYDKSLNRPVRAIVAVHVFGNGANMEALSRVSETYGLPLVEDAAEAVGTFYVSGKFTGRMAGTIGDFGVYSFNGNKILTTGGGGMLVARNADRLSHAKHLSTQAKSDALRFCHDEVGYNYRMTNLQAALGVAQLEQIESFIQNKEKNYRQYIELGVELLPFSPQVRANYWFYSHPCKNRDALITHLEQWRIQARPLWELNHLQPMYADGVSFDIRKAFEFHKTIVNIPCSSSLNSAQVCRVADAIKEFRDGGEARDD